PSSVPSQGGGARVVDDSGFRPQDDERDTHDGHDDDLGEPWANLEEGSDEPADDEGPLLRFDDSSYEHEQPHWTAPPTGELPRLFGDAPEAADDPWGSFAGGGPV